MIKKLLSDPFFSKLAARAAETRGGKVRPGNAFFSYRMIRLNVCDVSSLLKVTKTVRNH